MTNSLLLGRLRTHEADIQPAVGHVAALLKPPAPLHEIQGSQDAIVARLARYIIAVAIAAFVQGCASHSPAPDAKRPPGTMPSQGSLIGTWRFVSVTEGATGKVHEVGQVFFIRFYANGSCASWPVPKEEIYQPGAFNTDANRVSRGLYKLQDGKLTLPDAPLSNAVQLRLTDTKMWYSDDDGDTCLYFRVQPDLEPGRVP